MINLNKLSPIRCNSLIGLNCIMGSLWANYVSKKLTKN